MDVKKMVAEAAVEFIEDGMIVGLGTGSTAYWAIQKIGERISEGLKIKAVATSKASELLAKELKMPLVYLSDIDHVDLTIDGADEVDPDLNLIKGGGGALLREKIVAAASRELVIVVDETKLVEKLGTFPLPVEVVPFGVEFTRRRIERLGCKTGIRMRDEKDRYQTDNGNYIIDCEFGRIEDPEELNKALNMIPGVVENGLFIRMAARVLVGRKNGEIDIMKRIER
ncbi:MAG: ribose-5-phosphate isomerase RpiA [Firmicutes bacterium]|jgi:ribose 5-phosphate isomerase A|nr:ribose-5-phosphate isomerase RpiA [Bacillota bacterium]